MRPHHTRSAGTATFVFHPSYANPTTITEGSTYTYYIQTTGVSNGTTLYWSITHGTTTNADFSANSGSFTVNNNLGQFYIFPISDGINDGGETFTLNIRTVSISGPVVVTRSITVEQPPQSISVSVSNTNLLWDAAYYSQEQDSSGTLATFTIQNAQSFSSGDVLYVTVRNHSTNLVYLLDHTSPNSWMQYLNYPSSSVYSNAQLKTVLNSQGENLVATVWIAINNSPSQQNQVNTNWDIQVREGSSSGNILAIATFYVSDLILSSVAFLSCDPNGATIQLYKKKFHINGDPSYDIYGNPFNGYLSDISYTLQHHQYSSGYYQCGCTIETPWPYMLTCISTIYNNGIQSWSNYTHTNTCIQCLDCVTASYTVPWDHEYWVSIFPELAC